MVVNCEQVWREISNYVDGEVAAELRTAMDEHIHACAQCTSVLAGTRNVVALYGDERMLEVPAGFGRRLEKKLARESRRPGGWRLWSTWLIPLGALALMIVGFRAFYPFAPRDLTQSEVARLEKNIPPDLAIVAATDTKVFHVSGCDLIRDKDKDKLKTMTAKEAMRQGYVPCTRCLRKYLSAKERQSLDHTSPPQAEVDGDAVAEGLHGAGQ